MRPVHCAAASGLVLLLCGCGEAPTLEPPPAELSEEETGGPGELPPSYVSAPILFDLRPLLAELESTIPRRLGSIEKDRRLQVSGNAWVAPELSRSPFRFTFHERTVRVSSVFEYRARAWFKPLLIEQSVSCGMGEVRPRLRVAIETTYDLTPDWFLKTDSRVVDVRPVSREERDQCEITFLKIDVTGKVSDAAADGLRTALARLDRRLSRVSTRPLMEGIWEKLQQPISIAEGTVWLQIRPREVSLGKITASDSTLTARLDLLASPRMLSGPRPPDDTVALPNLGRTLTESDTAVVMMDGLLMYHSANQLLSDALVGKSFGSGWKRVKVEDVSMMFAGRGKVALAVRVSGRARGVVNVVGTPTYDPETDRITVPDLEFDVNSRNYLTRIAGWLLSGPFLGDIRTRISIPASVLLGEVMGMANRELNRDLSEGVRLRGDLGGARTMAVYATRRGLVAQARGLGRLWLEVSKEDLIPDRTRIRVGGRTGRRAADG